MELEKSLPASIDKLRLSEAREAINDAVWQSLSSITLQDAVEKWLDTLSNIHTRKSYRCAFQVFFQNGTIRPSTPLQVFALSNLNAILDEIKGCLPGKEATRQARCAAFLSFTKYLSRQTNGIIPKAEPSKEGTRKTFFKVREKVSTSPLNTAQWNRWLEALKKRNTRDWLIARLSLQGARRISEVLSLDRSQVDFSRSIILYQVSKTKGTAKTVPVHHSERLINELCHYIGQRHGSVFVTRNGSPVRYEHVLRSFKKAGLLSGITFPVTPHVLRASAITYLKSQGYNSGEIARLSGHASEDMVSAYDKRSLEDNPSREVFLC